MTNQPYFGDDRFSHMWEVTSSWTRFRVRPAGKKGWFTIQDNLTNFVVKVDKKSLSKPKFEIANWYNHRRAKHYGGRAERKPGKDARIGDALAVVSEYLLADGINVCYP